MAEKTIQKITSRTFSCVLFDLGSTLWYRDSTVVKELENHANEQTIALLRQTHVPLTLDGKDDREAGKFLRKAIKRHFREEIERDPTIEPEGAQVVQQVLEKLCHITCSRDLCTTVFETLDIRIRHTRRLFADTLPTLQEMKRRSLQLGIITNRHWGGKYFHEDLKPLGLTTYIGLDKTMISADLHIRKPSPEIYKRALKACNAQHDTTMMVGDSLIADVAGAQHQNIFAVWKPKSYHEVSAHLTATEGITVAEYNLQQLHLLKKHGKIERKNPYYSPRKGDGDLTAFFDGSIKPQLIIKDLEELLTWL